MRRSITTLLLLLFTLVIPLVAQTKDSTVLVCVKCVPTYVDSQNVKTDSAPLTVPVTVWSYITVRNTWRVYAWRDSTVKVTVPTPPPPPPPPPSGNDEPTPSGKILLADNFDAYTGSRPGQPWDCTPGSTDMQMTAGRTGKALRLIYTPSNFYSGCDLQFSTTGRVAVSYWFRINPAGYNVIEGDNTGSGMKWFTLWRPTAPRQTWGANQLGGVSAPTFGTHDNSSSNMPNPVNGPSGLWNKVNDGQWHRYTIYAVTGNAGLEQCWLDGVKIFDTTGRGYNRSSEGFNLLQIGHDKVRAPLGTRYLDIDDFTAWVP